MKYSVKMSTYFGGMPFWLVFCTYRDVSTLLFFLWRVWVGVTRCSVPLATCNEVGFPSLLGGEWVGWDSVQNFPALLLTTALITGLTRLGSAFPSHPPLLSGLSPSFVPRVSVLLNLDPSATDSPHAVPFFPHGNHSDAVLLGLFLIFTQHRVFEIYPCCRMHRFLIVSVHCMQFLVCVHQADLSSALRVHG